MTNTGRKAVAASLAAQLAEIALRNFKDASEAFAIAPTAKMYSHLEKCMITFQESRNMQRSIGDWEND